jgi:hypothetical protein
MPNIQSNVVSWLLQSVEPWVAYNTLTDLLQAKPDDPEVQSAYQAMQTHPKISVLLEALEVWPQTPTMKRAYDPKDSLWKLQTLADFGLKRDDERIEALAERVFAAQAEDGGFLNGGFDHTHTWDKRPYMCISHVMTYALACFGYLHDPRLIHAYEQISAWQRLDGGWHPNQQNLPGNNGEAELSCPFGTQNVLRALSIHPTLRTSDEAKRAAKYLLSCWERRSEPFRPVGFGIGSDWQKMTYPFVQYGLLKSVDILSSIPEIEQDARFQEMLDLLERKRDENGYWKAESVSKAWSDFDFGQKKGASGWITFLALRSLKRAGR